MIAPTPASTVTPTSMPNPNLTAHDTLAMRPGARGLEPDVDALIAEWRGEDYRAPIPAIQAYVRAVYKVLGKWRLVGELGMHVTGRKYRDPEGTAKAWGDGTSNVPGDVLFGLQQVPALHHLRLSDFALAPPGADPAVFHELREQIATLAEHLDRLDETLNVHLAVTLGDTKLGPALRGALERAQAGGVDPAAAEYLERARGVADPDEDATAER
jgi:hypothetical protein